MTRDGPPALRCGQRFRVRSRSGREHLLTFLAGDGDGGLIVRLDDRRVARLDPDRVRWETFARVTSSEAGTLAAGDEVRVEQPSGALEGVLRDATPGALVVGLADGREATLPRRLVLALHLLFRAQELRPGDAFRVGSKSGNTYRGVVASVEPGGRLRVRLEGGKTVVLRPERIDLDSLDVFVPIPVDADP